jgi:hypothetical protein
VPLKRSARAGCFSRVLSSRTFSVDSATVGSTIWATGAHLVLSVGGLGVAAKCAINRLHVPRAGTAATFLGRALHEILRFLSGPHEWSRLTRDKAGYPANKTFLIDIGLINSTVCMGSLLENFDVRNWDPVDGLVVGIRAIGRENHRLLHLKSGRRMRFKTVNNVDFSIVTTELVEKGWPMATKMEHFWKL